MCPVEQADRSSAEDRGGEPTGLHGADVVGTVRRYEVHRCDVCLKVTKRRCEGCRSAYLCDKICQKEHWYYGHKYLCAHMEEARILSSDASGKWGSTRPAVYRGLGRSWSR